MEADDTTINESPESSSHTVTPEQREEALREANGGSRSLAFLWSWAKILCTALVLCMVIRTFVVEAFHIPTGSMENTILPGDFVLVNKLAYGAEVPFTHERLPALEHPSFGDVIVFDYPRDPSQNFVKRLVGLPGDTLAMKDGVLIRNGERIMEPYVRHEAANFDPSADDFTWQRDYVLRSLKAAPSYHPSRNNWGPLVVPPKHYFVLGDNRDNSLDSRFWGFVPDSLVTGTPLFVYYSYAPDSGQTFAWLTHVRWKRLGEFVH